MFTLDVCFCVILLRVTMESFPSNISTLTNQIEGYKVVALEFYIYSLF